MGLNASARARITVTVGLLLAGAACHKDFDGLFTGDGNTKDNPSTSGGTSGTDKPLDCTCPPCTTGDCSFKCPSGCPTCQCGVYECDGNGCTVACTERTTCAVVCPEGTTCNLDCEEGASCKCSGTGCVLNCIGRGKPPCGDGGDGACSYECK